MITRRIARPLGALAKEQWTCPSCIHASFIQQSSQRRSLSATARRDITLPTLPMDKEFREEGVPGLFSKIGYQLGWTTYQGMLVTKLNELLAGEPDEHADAKHLVLKYARDPQYASIFNHASMAWNNHFFYQALSLSPTELHKQPGGLQESLIQTFGSIDTLKTTFLDTAAAMFAPGFVWLVWADKVSRDGAQSSAHASKGGWRILTTYAAGTPWPEAGYRQQGVDMNNVGAFGAHSLPGKEQLRLPVGGAKIMPVLCASTWQHSYIYDFGVTGKSYYLNEWWKAINWQQVDVRTPIEAKNQGNRTYLRSDGGQYGAGRRY